MLFSYSHEQALMASYNLGIRISTTFFVEFMPISPILHTFPAIIPKPPANSMLNLSIMYLDTYFPLIPSGILTVVSDGNLYCFST